MAMTARRCALILRAMAAPDWGGFYLLVDNELRPEPFNGVVGLLAHVMRASCTGPWLTAGFWDTRRGCAQLVSVARRMNH